MHWLIQSKFDYDPKVRELVGNLQRLKINHSFCKAIPFSEEMTSDVDLDKIVDPIFTYGSYTLSKIVVKRGYKPGAFISPNLGQDFLLSNYGDRMLNSDMLICELGEVLDNVPDEFFIRPVKDSKSFTAKIIR
jgi:hypothetical protein